MKEEEKEEEHVMKHVADMYIVRISMEIMINRLL